MPAAHSPPTTASAAEVCAGTFLATLAAPGRPSLAAADVAIVFAHPDDETLGCGAQLARLAGATLVCVTDGAPRNCVDACANGFADAECYAQARRAELCRALAEAGVRVSALILNVPDQEAGFNSAAIAQRLAALFAERGIRIALTHAYEGGHPDHDATAFAVHAAAALLARRGRRLAIVDMPFYRLGPRGRLLQSFAPEQGRKCLTLPLSADEQARKRRMIAAHASQQAVLSAFALDAERFRCAPACDFTEPPNGGRLLYEQYAFGMTGARWRDCVAEALRALDLPHSELVECA
jgi:LmbE family N-acetylglucosaminyl deacetylase